MSAKDQQFITQWFVSDSRIRIDLTAGTYNATHQQVLDIQGLARWILRAANGAIILVEFVNVQKQLSADTTASLTQLRLIQLQANYLAWRAVHNSMIDTLHRTG